MIKTTGRRGEQVKRMTERQNNNRKKKINGDRWRTHGRNEVFEAQKVSLRSQNRPEWHHRTSQENTKNTNKDTEKAPERFDDHFRPQEPTIKKKPHKNPKRKDRSASAFSTILMPGRGYKEPLRAPRRSPRYLRYAFNTTIESKTSISWKSLFLLSKITICLVRGIQKSLQNPAKNAFEKKVDEKLDFESIWGLFWEAFCLDLDENSQ